MATPASVPASEAAAKGPSTKKHAPLRHGSPPRLSGYVQLRASRFSSHNSSSTSASGQRYMKLIGEVLSMHMTERSLPVMTWEACKIDIILAGSRGFRIKYKENVVHEVKHVKKRKEYGKRKWTFIAEKPEVARRWVEGVSYSSKRSFWKWYELGTIIGVGSYARVHRCRCREGEGEWAVKIIKKSSYPITARGWIDKEVEAVAGMWHENIVGVRDVFATVDKVYIVMEFMRGGTLEDYLEIWKKLPEPYSRVVARELLKGIEYCHGVHVVHRDIKPGNIFMSQTKFPTAIRLGDFGFCTFLDEKKIDTRVLRTQIGTLGYVAREVTLREKYGPPADLWSAGCVIYEMLCGYKPFEGKTQRETFNNIRAGRFSFAGPAWKSVSEDAKSLIQQLLQVDPNKRVSAFGALQHSWFTNYHRIQRPISAPINGMVRWINSKHHSASPLFTRSLSELGGKGGPGSLISGSASSSNSLSSGSMEPGKRAFIATPSIKRIQSIGLQQATKENPAMMKRLLSSPAVRKQLSAALPYRRKLVVVARAFQAASRLRAMARGRSLTKHAKALEDDPKRNVWDAVHATFLFKTGEQRAEQDLRAMNMAMESVPVKVKPRRRKRAKEDVDLTGVLDVVTVNSDDEACVSERSDKTGSGRSKNSKSARCPSSNCALNAFAQEGRGEVPMVSEKLERHPISESLHLGQTPPSPPPLPELEIPDSNDFEPSDDTVLLGTFEPGDSETDSEVLVCSDMSAEVERPSESEEPLPEVGLVQRMTSKFESFARPASPVKFTERNNVSARRRRIAKRSPRKRRTAVVK